MLSIFRRFDGRYSRARSLVTNQGSFVLWNIKQITDAYVKYIFKDVTNMYVVATSGIFNIFYKQDLIIYGTYQFLPVMAN